MTKKNWIIFGIILCCAYIISPVDLVPEIALGPLGVIDDAGVLGFMLFLIKQGVVGIDNVQKSVEPPKLTDET